MLTREQKIELILKDDLLIYLSAHKDELIAMLLEDRTDFLNRVDDEEIEFQLHGVDIENLKNWDGLNEFWGSK